MTTLCCLLSDQHVPNLLSVHHFRPDRLVLIESEAMQKRGVSGNFLAALHEAGLNYKPDETCDIIPLQDVSNFQRIADALRRAFGQHPTDPWIVNLTGGTKPMSIVAYEFFKALGARLVYVELSRPNQILDVESGQVEVVDHHLSITEFLLGYGFEHHKKLKKVAEAEDRARQWFDLARLVALHAADRNLLKVDRNRWSRARKKGIELVAGELAPEATKLGDALANTFDLTLQTTSLIGSLDKYQCDFLTGGWLEAFLWNLLSRHQEELGIWDVRLGIEPRQKGTDASNDFDIAFMRDFALHMVECKSGDQSHGRDVDILYKVEAVTRQFRALRVQSALATTSQQILDAQGNIKTTLRDRAAIYNCRFITLAEIQRLAKEDEPAAALSEIFFNKNAKNARAKEM